MKTLALITFITILALGRATSTSAQAEIDPLRRWDESVDALLRRVSPSVVQITVTGYGAVSEGARGNADVVIGRHKTIPSDFVLDAPASIITTPHALNPPQLLQ